jgi:hypothetical protein
MNWYLAKLIFQIQRNSTDGDSQFDEQWRMIRADEVEWAYEKASVIGKLEESCFLSEHEENIEWKFIEVSDIIQIGSLSDGMKILSHTEEPDDVKNYLRMVKLNASKSMTIAKNIERNQLINL